MAEGRFTNPVVASLAGIKDFFTRQKLASRLSDQDRADGKTVMITGANSGLGKALAVDFARRGAKVIMACRSQIPEAGDKVKRLSGSKNVEMRYIDLSKIGTIHDFVQSLIDDGITIDICILNAAVALPGPRKTETGQDEFFQVNYLSNVTLTLLLIQHKAFELKNEGQLSRLIFISSDSHQGASYIDYEEFGRYFEYGVSKAISNYSYFKLVLNTYATELSRRINREEVRLSMNVICPGPVHSNIVKEAPWLLRIILKGIFWIVFRSPAKAALPVVYMALSPDYEGTTNEYLHMFNPKKMDPKVYESAEGQKLWDRSFQLLKDIDPAHEEYMEK
ncbi:MAG: SDR family NAD(P)-dependent oxidoreductase [Desulfobulbaceae bacterium]|nr:SDR family NAD(P)-dependent oxidoreductase [Desulfobulbaceae bacterium]